MAETNQLFGKPRNYPFGATVLPGGDTFHKGSDLSYAHSCILMLFTSLENATRSQEFPRLARLPSPRARQATHSI